MCAGTAIAFIIILIGIPLLIWKASRRSKKRPEEQPKPKNDPYWPNHPMMDRTKSGYFKSEVPIRPKTSDPRPATPSPRRSTSSDNAARSQGYSDDSDFPFIPHQRNNFSDDSSPSSSSSDDDRFSFGGGGFGGGGGGDSYDSDNNSSYDSGGSDLSGGGGSDD